jgi:hypothetical protein
MGQSVKFHAKIKRGGALLYHSLSCCRVSIYGGGKYPRKYSIGKREGEDFISMRAQVISIYSKLVSLSDKSSLLSPSILIVSPNGLMTP